MRVLFHRVSLTKKMVLTTILLGSVLYVILDQIHTRAVTKVFHSQLTQTLNKQAISYRYRFHRYIRTYYEAAQLFASRKNVHDYVVGQNWSSKDNFPIKTLKRPPQWFVGTSTQRSFITPRYAILFDPMGRAREVYQNSKLPLPEALLRPSKRLMAMSQEDSYLLNVDNYPYMTTSAQIKGEGSKVLATLMLVTPFDEKFLLDSQGSFLEGDIITLINEDTNQVIVSSDLKKLPAGTTLNLLPDEFISTGQEMFEYGSSDMNFKLAILSSTLTIETFISNLVLIVREQRIFTALAFILSFTLLMVFITRRIRRLSHRVSEFSIRSLGGKVEAKITGDQLHHLELRFQQLTKEIISSQEVIRRETEEASLRKSQLQKKEHQVRLLKSVTEALQIGVIQHSHKGLQALNNHMVQFEKRSGSLSDYDISKGEMEERTITTLDGKDCIYYIFSPDFPENEHIILVKDLTEQKQTEAEKENLETRLQQAQKMEAVGTLAGGIAHDFNNILAIIIGYSEMAIADAPPGTGFERDLGNVLQAANRAKDLVKQILAFSRQSQVDRMPISLQPLVKEGLKMLRSSIPTTINITENIDPRCGVILADPTQTHQILMNLCTNAYHAMDETGGVLSVTLKPIIIEPDGKEMLLPVSPGEYVEFIVTDTGIGIGPDVIEKIFDPYFTTKEIGKGTGMGLAIIHGIMEDYGGTITVESKLGKGSTFRVYFPVIEQNALPEIKPPENILGGKERILFVDDEELLAKMGKDMLERLGYHVIVRRSSLEALETFQNSPDEFDVVITDQTMPGMTGSDLARRMMQIRPNVPIILCTGHSNLIDEQSAKTIGIKEFALKPLAKKDIAKLIRKVLDSRR